MKASVTAVALAACLALTSGCRDGGTDFELTGKLFVFNYRVATATYLITLRPTGPVPDGLTAVATFQDPAGGEPIVVRQRVWPKLEKLSLESPPVRCIVKDRPYSVTIAIEDGSGAGLQTLNTTVTSSLDQTVLPDRPLVVGPVYTPNPDLAGHPSGKLDGADAEPCPAHG